MAPNAFGALIIVTPLDTEVLPEVKEQLRPAVLKQNLVAADAVHAVIAGNSWYVFLLGADIESAYTGTITRSGGRCQWAKCGSLSVLLITFAYHCTVDL